MGSSLSTKSSPTSTKPTALDALRAAGITIASDGAQYKKIAEFNPTDATTNPSLVYAAVCSPGSKYAFLLDEAVQYALEEAAERNIEQKTELALDYLLASVGAQISALIPGRVSLSIDPRLFLPTTTSPFDDEVYTHVLLRCLSLYSLASYVFGKKNGSSTKLNAQGPRLLLKIPATPLGIRIAATLESQHRIPTNMTLIFGIVQALACAQAGVSVISPFVGRVKDFYDSRGRTVPTNSDGSLDLAQHPGIQLVRRIKTAFKREGYEGKTEIMGAGFRSVDEIIELGRTGKEGGPDLLTLPPDLLAGLRDRASVQGSTSNAAAIPVTLELLSPAPTYFTPAGPTTKSLALFERDLAAEEIALDKVPDGLKKFSADTDKLDDAVRAAIVARLEEQKKVDRNSVPLVAPGTTRVASGDILRGRSVRVN